MDLAIVGAGPAGCAAAIWAAARGLNVVLVSRIESRFRPGECLHPGIEILLRDLGVLDEVLERSRVQPSVRTVEIEGRRLTDNFGSDADGPWRAFHVFRSDLDAILLSRAQQLGVALYLHKSRVTPLVQNGRVYGIDVGGRLFHSTFVIDASGPNAWLTHAMGRELMAGSPRLTAFYGYSRGRMPDEQSFTANSAGWQWTAQISPSLVNWTSLQFGVHKKPRPPATVSSLSPVGSSSGADVTWRIAPSVAGASYFIVGDAAVVIDPAAGNGVLRAVMSGIKAAYNAHAVLCGKTSPTEAARDYEKWLRLWFEADTAKLSAMYDSLKKDWRTPNMAVAYH